MIIDALVPCYNEAPRLNQVLTALENSPQIRRIIFVDGGSTDASAAIAQKFSKIKLIKLDKKGGKGQDVARGLKEINTPTVFLCDADLKGLTPRHVEKMLREYEKNPDGLVVGLTQKSRYYFYHWLRSNIFPTISGMRVISTKNLAAVLSNPLSHDWGIEPYMNYFFAKNGRPITKILLDGVNDIPKPGKEGYGWKPHLAEAFNVMQKYILIYAKELPIDYYSAVKSFIFPQMSGDKKTYATDFWLIDSVKINFAKVGQGPPLLLVHGWANNWEGWKPLIPYLKDRFSLYLIDLPGFGDSGNLATYNVESLSRYLFKFSQKISPPPLAAIGLSMGTLVISEMIRRHPTGLTKAILIGPPIKDVGLNLIARTLRYSLWFIKNFRPGEIAIKKLVETRVAAYAVSKYVNMYRFNRFLVDSYGMIGKKKMRKEAFTQMGISGANYDLKKVLEALPVATLIIYGREDKISSPQFARRELLPKNAHLFCVDIAEAGHVVPWEKPQEVAEAITQFLETKI